MAGLLDNPRRRNKGLLDVEEAPGLLGRIARTVRQEYAGKTPQQAIADVPASMYANPLVNAAIGFTPVVGDIQSGVEALRSAAGGRWGEAALNGVGVLPFLPSMAGMVKGMGNIEDALKAGGKTQYEIAHEIAQRNAALPVEQGGLGLPPDNTAMDRAKAMGFKGTWYHGTQEDIQGGFRVRPHEETKIAGASFTKSPKDASGFAFGKYVGDPTDGANVLPVMIRGKRQMGFGVLSDAMDKEMVSIKDQTDFTKKLFDKKDIQGIDYTEFISPEISVVDPSRIRSRFAAFDPLRKHETDILAGLIPWMVPVGLLGAGLLNTQGQYY